MPPRPHVALPIVLAACVGCATNAAGAHRDATPGDGPLSGDEYRYDRMDVPSRALHDVVAIPAGAVRWSGSDWSQLALWSGGIAALMVPAPRSADSRLDGWFRREVNPRVPTVWSVPMQATLWSGVAVGGFGTWWWSARAGRDDIAQGLSLMGESLAVAQAYHVAIKLSLGREGPRSDGEEPRTYGPGVGFRLYPSGAPSGHAATLYSLMSAGFAYFEPPAWAQITGHVLLGGLVAFHAVDHKHYVSDLVWGGAMGWYVGQWVVRHRASRPPAERRAAEPTARAAIVPAALPGGAGAALVGSF
ncbi:MAG TPA: phosphatase PAP2 family protein [Anaeromyxobacteraceae bacterium]|nr:phosphatase PAP2 family protein [Anaeromyxobacteraceae bacterium]